MSLLILIFAAEVGVALGLLILAAVMCDWSPRVAARRTSRPVRVRLSADVSAYRAAMIRAASTE